ncbi:MAG: hypothetical protein QXO93_00015 [Acidilobaceae archaeon]
MAQESEIRKSKKIALHGVVGGVFLIGLAILFYFDALWPWILALVGFIIIVEALAKYYLW